MMTTFEKIIKNLNRIERELVKPEAERRDITLVFFFWFGLWVYQ
ncbi:phage protein [Streptococcus pyogenes]|nr:phage protein [Streptococcus pyogenes]